MEEERKMSSFIAIKSKGTIVKMFDDEIKEAHETNLSKKEFNKVHSQNINGDDNKIFDCGWISALKYMKNKVEAK